MKRFGFFLAVVSIGLVVLLLVSGQFGEMLSPGKGLPGEGEETVATDPFGEPIETDVSETAPPKNLLRTEETDYDLGRPLFFIEGELASAVQMDVTMRTQVREYVFENVKLELPLYPERAAIEPVDRFLLTIDRVRYEALSPEEVSTDSRRSTSEVRLIGALEGKGLETGFPQFETRDGKISWDADSTAHLSGDEQLDLRYPAVTLRTQSGFEAHVAGQAGLEKIELRPPLVVALSSDATGSILGFEGTAQVPDASGESGESRVHLFSLGPMIIDPARSTAQIEGPVFVYQVPAETSLNPPEIAEIPQHHFRCERMRLELDSSTRAITRLVAERRDDPVTVHFGERYRIEGDRLEWSRGDQEARLDGGVRILGELGEVHAGAARLRPDDGVCRLVDGVTATLRGNALARRRASEPNPATDGDGWDERLAGTWELAAATAELHYSSASSKRSLQLLRALAADGDRVTVRESREEGAVILGGEMTYTPDSGMIAVLPGEDGRRPEFVEGRNRGTAGRIEASVLRPVLEFSEAVDVTLVEPPIGAEHRFADWWVPEGVDPSTVRTRLTADRVKLSSGVDRRLSRIEAWGAEDTPLELDHQGERRLRFLANAIDWDGTRSLIVARGGDAQRMILDGRADLTARELDFSLDTWVATARGAVVGNWVQLPPEDAAGPAPPPIVARGDRAEIRLRPPPSDGHDGEVVPSSTGAGAAGERDRTGEVIAAHIFADRPEGLSIDDGPLRLVGDEWIWDAATDEFRLGGGRGRQRVFSHGAAGEDELSADHIIYRGSDRTLLLDGDARGTIHQGSVSPELEPDSARLAWQVFAGRMTVTFRLEGPEERLVPERIVAGSEIRLVQEDSLIEFRGNTAEWDFATERLRIHTPDARGFQTLTQGGVRGSEIIAREILVVRPTALEPGNLDTLEALFIDVLKAEVKLAEEDPDDPARPTGFTLDADNLLATFTGLRKRTTGEDDDPLGMPISEVRAWGGVDFQGGEYHLVCHRAAYRRTTRNLVFQGDGRSKVQVLSQAGAAIRPLTQKELSLEWFPNRSFGLRSVPGGAQWSRADIEESLRLFDRLDRRDTGE